MPKDINIVVVSGRIDNGPNIITNRHGKRICLFNIESIEKYKLSTGQAAQHENFLTVEVLGRNVDKCIAELQKDDRVQIHGYLRVDDVNGVEKVRVRAYHIEKD